MSYLWRSFKHIFSKYKIYSFEQIPVVKEQIFVEKPRVIERASDKKQDYLQPLKQFLWKGLQVARKPDRNKT